MSKKDIIVGIEIGSSSVKTVITQLIPSEEKPRIVGVGVSPSAGVRKGIIVDLEEATRSISNSLDEAERMAGFAVSRATLSVGGNHICSQYSRGVIAVGRADGEVTEDDVERVIRAAQAISVTPNKEIIHIIPKDYTLDNQKNIKDPLGMNGVRLEVDALIIEGSSPFIRNLTKCVEQAGINIDSFLLSPLAAAQAALYKTQKELGVILVDIGGGSTSLAVFRPIKDPPIFTKAYKKRFGEEEACTSETAQLYESLGLLAYAMEMAGTISDVRKIRAAMPQVFPLEKRGMLTPSGIFGLRENGAELRIAYGTEIIGGKWSEPFPIRY